MGVLQASTAVYPGLPERLEISGTGGTVIVEAGDIRVAELADENGDAGAYGRPVASPGPPAVSAAADPQAVTGDAHRAQIADFLAALDGGRRPLVTGEEARASVAVIRAVYESARLGRPVALVNRHRPAAPGGPSEAAFVRALTRACAVRARL